MAAFALLALVLATGCVAKLGDRPAFDDLTDPADSGGGGGGTATTDAAIVPAPDAEPVSAQCGDGTAEGEALCTIDLHAVVFHDSLDVSQWAETKTITAVDLDANSGVRVTLSPYNPARDADSWPDFIMFPPDGDLRYTLWLFVHMHGAWHGAAVHEFWKDREWTGAPLLTNYADWIYPNPGSPWGAMADHRPREGDTIGFMTTAGDLRRHKDALTVLERSNVVTVRLTSTASYTFP